MDTYVGIFFITKNKNLIKNKLFDTSFKFKAPNIVLKLIFFSGLKFDDEIFWVSLSILSMLKKDTSGKNSFSSLKYLNIPFLIDSKLRETNFKDIEDFIVFIKLFSKESTSGVLSEIESIVLYI